MEKIDDHMGIYIDVKKFHVSFEIELSLGTSTFIKIVCNMLYYYVIVLVQVLNHKRWEPSFQVEQAKLHSFMHAQMPPNWKVENEVVGKCRKR